ncbi:nucleotidyl transferase AbiEii/AbiGii toxin family protein [Phaeocystidibacter marisrubri]|uniref:Nucleotidyl transferase AbiEii/AbiGii toxin family protein n=1 Tax=Phaeocystidibacter marisrubri TaxID=1577780 RepID=A0A6L3ZDW8_9FLAO|nr:nucleotidyl transferase AbiEii/AbiGii toxin family protein [Phaeocystidibacter marisrubri]KAB2815637.1 nucleotidyl transferase AbiEii/AbiGii toxin family protein [Phaeocystidibacter marisrubri]GGH64927.1 hypothetical protein GCM10011318_01420 [Phaeocystidibacter marisrubri]
MLYKNTVSPLLWNSLVKLMQRKEFNPFRLVGGTSLSLQLGHRESVDIDLFTDVEYGTLDHIQLEQALLEEFPVVQYDKHEEFGMGKSYFIGNSHDSLIKLDLFYTDPFVFPIDQKEKIRFASIHEIAAMKLEVISNGGRKKDFWDIHELLDHFRIEELLEIYHQRNPFGDEPSKLRKQLIHFEKAEHEPSPNCLRNKAWELIKLDLEDLV